MGTDHNVFVSWSGEASGRIANEFSQFIIDVVPRAKVFLSKEIERGKLWSVKIAEALQKCEIGVICLTPDNLASPWVHYEAGALAKTLGERTRLCSYLLDGLSVKDLKEPLSEFQASKPDKDSTRELLRSINTAINGDDAASKEIVDKLFALHWREFERSLRHIPLTNVQKVFLEKAGNSRSYIPS
jgi:hypothetical protein